MTEMRRGLKVKRAGTSFQEAEPHPAVEERLEQGSELGETRGLSWRGQRERAEQHRSWGRGESVCC